MKFQTRSVARARPPITPTALEQFAKAQPFTAVTETVHGLLTETLRHQRQAGGRQVTASHAPWRRLDRVPRVYYGAGAGAAWGFGGLAVNGD